MAISQSSQYKLGGIKQSNAVKIISMTHGGDKAKTVEMGQRGAIVVVKVKKNQGSSPSSDSRWIAGEASQALRPVEAPHQRGQLWLKVGQRLTKRRSGLGTNVAAYEAHASVCASLRKTSGNQPLNANR